MCCKQSRKGFSFVELLLVMAVFSILISILTKSLSQLNKSAGSLRCINNGRLISQGVQLFSEDSNGIYPITMNDGTGKYFDELPWSIQSLANGPGPARISWDDQIGVYFGIELTAEQAFGYHYKNSLQTRKMAEIIKCPESRWDDPTNSIRSYGIHKLGHSNKNGSIFDPFGDNFFRGISSQWFQHYNNPSFYFEGYKLKVSNLSRPSRTIAFAEHQDPGNMIGSPYDNIHLGYYGQILGPNGLMVSNDIATLEEIWPHGFGQLTFIFGDGHSEHINILDTINPNFDVWETTRFKKEKDNYLWDSWPSE